MSNPFERFGLRWLSPSSLNLWNAAPGLWALRYCGNFRDDAGPAASRGKAVGEGFAEALREMGRDYAVDKAVAVYDADNGPDENQPPKVRKERDAVISILDVLIEDSPAIIGKLEEAERKVELNFDGVAVPVIGYIDYVLKDNSFIELKSTMRCPNTPREDHVRQASFYKAATGMRGTILYASPTRAASYPIGDNQSAFALEQMRRDALSLQRFLSSCETPQEVIGSLPMNQSDFRWSEAATTKLGEFV